MNVRFSIITIPTGDCPSVTSRSPAQRYVSLTCLYLALTYEHKPLIMFCYSDLRLVLVWVVCHFLQRLT